MRALALIATSLVMLFAPGLALAYSEARQGDDWVRIFDSPCVSAETLARIPEQSRNTFSKAQGSFSGQKYFGCWRKMGDSVYIMWEDGDQGIVPQEDLKPVPEA